MRYLFIHQNFPGQFRHIAPALAARGHEVVGLGIHRPAERLPGVKHVQYRVTPPQPVLPQDHPLAEWSSKIARGEAAARAMGKLKTEGFTPEVVVAHPGWGESLFVRDVFPAARFVAFAEYYYSAEGGDMAFDPEFPGPQDRAKLRLKNTHLLHALAECDIAVAPTQFQRDRHPPALRERIRVIHDGIDTGRFRPDRAASVHLRRAGVPLRAGDEVVTFVARQLEPYRGYHVFMRMLPLLQRLRPQARIVIVGGDDTSYGAAPPPGRSWKRIFLDEVSSQLDLRKVHFVGRVPHEVLTQLMQVSAAHVYLTYPFVLSWSMLEAMSIGCVVIGSDTAPVREVIEHGRNGLLVDFFDAQGLAHRVAEVLADPAGFRPLRKAARDTIATRYDLRTLCLPAYLDLLEAPG